jgi:hypothetical protein
MLFVNYETISCNVFELLNIVVGLVIIFEVIFCSNYRTSMFFICKKNIWLGFYIRAANLFGQEPIYRPYRPMNNADPISKPKEEFASKIKPLKCVICTDLAGISRLSSL